MKVVVTGGKGFIGSHLVNFLKDKGFFVRNVDIKKDSILKTEEDEFLQLDLRDYNNCKKAVKDMDGVFNLSANMGGIGYISEYNAPIISDNVKINVNMLDACINSNVPKIFFSSSFCVYPRFKQKYRFSPKLKEEDVIPAYPDSAYGWEKLFSEIMYRSYHVDYGIQIRIARFENIYGTYCDYSEERGKAPASICRKVALAEDGTSIIIWGDGKQTRSFLHINDCLDGILRIFNSNYNFPFNLTSSERISINNLAKMIIKISGKKLKIVHDLSKPQGVRGRCGDYSLAKKLLGWEPKVKLEEGMKELYEWVKSQVIK
ncbi:MAG: NAD-dependent epimerase/dehydratase family protein [Candidatus Aenigmatarchaeota archaeon]